MATVLTIAASIVTGIIVGGWLTLVVASAAMSRSQEHMEKRVRYWQARAEAGWPDMESAVSDYRRGG